MSTWYCNVSDCNAVCLKDGAVTGRTTNFSRTIATLQGVLTGLYPDASQPIPVATASDMDEIMFANVLSCERLADVMKRATYELRGDQAHQTCIAVFPSWTIVWLAWDYSYACHQ